MRVRDECSYGEKYHRFSITSLPPHEEVKISGSEFHEFKVSIYDDLENTDISVLINQNLTKYSKPVERQGIGILEIIDRDFRCQSFSQNYHCLRK